MIRIRYGSHHVNVFLWYFRYLPQAGTVLDWGFSPKQSIVGSCGVLIMAW